MARAAVVWLALVAAASVCLAAGGDDQAGGLVRVNDELITEDALTHYLKLFELGLDQPLPEGLSPLEREALDAQKRRAGLQTLVDRRLLVQAARAEYLGETRMEDAVKKLGDDAFQDFVREQGSLVKAGQLLADLGCSADDYRAFQSDAILISQLLRDHVYDTLRVSPAEVRSYYDEHKAEFVLPRQVVFRQILFVVTDPKEEEAARKAAADALARLEGGADFAALADELSADRDNNPGGLHKVFVPEEVGDWLPPVVEGLQPGQLSGVVRVAGGVAVARLEQVVPQGPITFEQVQATIQQGLLQRKRAAALADYLRKLRSDAKIEYLPGAAVYGFRPQPKPPAPDAGQEGG